MLNGFFELRNWLPALVMTGCGALLFLVLVNRRLLIVRDSRLKLPMLVVAFAVLTGGSVFLAVSIPMAWRIGIPVLVVLAIGAGEWRRLRIRRACAGSPPEDTVFHDVPLLRPVTTTDLVVHRYTVTLPAWTGKPFRIAHLSDFHVHPRFDESYYRSTLDRAEALKPDYVFFTGDYVTRCVSIPILERVMRPIGAAGNFGVLGNHDHWTDPERIRALLEAKGIRMLLNTTLGVERDGQRIELVGCDYTGFKDIRIPPFPAGPGLKLVLCHTPDAIYKLANLGADIVFSGHNHAGQARLPWLGALIVPSHLGRRFDHGHFVIRDTHLFVSSGIGAATPPLRFYCQPDIFIVDVVGAGRSP